MEQFRLLLAVVLCVAVFGVWNMFFGVPPQKQNGQTLISAEKIPEAEKSRQETARTKTTGQSTVLPQTPQDRPAKSYEVETPFFVAGFSDKGATITHLTLKNYRETNKPDSPLKEMIPAGLGAEAIKTSISGGTGFNDTGNTLFEAVNARQSTKITDSEAELAFYWVSPEGIRVDKIYTFFADKPYFKYKIGITNGSDTVFKNSITVLLNDAVSSTKKAIGFEGPATYVDRSLETMTVEKVKNKGFEKTGKISWIASLDRYFMKAVIPEDSQTGSMNSSASDNGTFEIRLTSGEKTIKPGEKLESSYDIYLGAKHISTLKTIGKNLDAAVDFGWFGIISKFCLMVMNFIHKYIPNYGIAIILLTLLIKLMLWPLGTKSYKSMADMKKLQPHITKIREKHENDKTKMNQEIMALYKTYKVNPMSGCLPLLAQMPIFIGLYRMLYESVELRHAPFFGWIQDLSVPDRLFSFDISVWGIEPPVGIPVMTLIMGATMFLQQKMSPPAGGDPIQAKMFLYVMPVMMTLIFINFPAGLVLYWLVNNIVSMAQQYYIQKLNA